MEVQISKSTEMKKKISIALKWKYKILFTAHANALSNGKEDHCGEGKTWEP